QVSYGLHALLRRNAANVHKKEQWSVIFALLQAAGAALTSDYVEEAREAREQMGGGERNAYSDTESGWSARMAGSDRGYTSDDPSARQFRSGSSLASSTANSPLPCPRLPARSGSISATRMQREQPQRRCAPWADRHPRMRATRRSCCGRHSAATNQPPISRLRRCSNSCSGTRRISRRRTWTAQWSAC
ncbi:hypothetical protein PMAYCL1PPCAC_10019, partial [Pristionchus mayeri]